jgi:hypothetical protein
LSKFLEADKIAALARLQAVTNIPSIAIESSAELLANALLAANAVPMNSFRDALHIAIATTQDIDFLLTWNFKHINNAETRNIIADVIANHGWPCPTLCSPEELGVIDNV